MPFTRLRQSMIKPNGSITGSLSGTSSYSRRALTASYALNASGGSISYITGSPVVGQYIVVSGSNTTQYALIQNVTNPEHLLVSVNGVVQNYSSSYTVTGSTLNFYQPYDDGDEIDVRFLNGGTTVQTGSIAKQTVWTNVTSGSTNTITGLSLSSNKWDVSVVEEWDAATLDQYYNSCSLLLHLNGSNGSTTITDNSKNNLAVTSVNGAAISTAQSKFGGSSVFFDGTNDYLSISSPTPGFSFGTGDFTIEMWVYKTISSLATILDSRSGNTGTPWAVTIDNTTNFPYFYDGVSSLTSNIALTLNSWVHLAVVRTSGVLKVFVNGVQGYSAAHSVNLDRTAGLIIGNHVVGNFPFAGYIDELRITKGVARYTSNFTPQKYEFPNSRNQVLTRYVGLVGGIDDKYVDYGVQKLSNSSLKLTRLTYPNQPIVGSGSLSGSVSRVYVNVLDYDNVSISGSISNAVTASYAVTSAPRTAIYRYGTTSVVNVGSYTNTPVKYDTAVTDSTGWYDNTNGRFTPTVAGWYQVSAGARVYGGAANAEGYFTLLKNGNQIAIVGGIGYVYGFISILVYFNGTTDYIQFCSNMSTTATNAQNLNSTPFTMVYMTP